MRNFDEINDLNLRRQSGFSVLEVLVAASLTLVASLSIGVVFREVSKSRARATYISDITAIESSLTTALLDETKYRDPTVRAALLAGGKTLSYTVSGNAAGTSFSYEIRPGSPVSFNSRDLRTCSGFPSPACDIQLVLGVSKIADQVFFAYRFQHDGEFNKSLLNFRGAGSASDSGLTSEDFTLPLPYEYLYGSLHLDCPNDSVGARGLSRNEGRVSCVTQPKNECPPGTLPKSIKFNSQTESVEFVCSAPAQTVGCRAKYALESVDLPSLDPGNSKQGSCVYQYANSGSGPTFGPSASISQEFCPEDYRSTSTCQLANIRSTLGQCPDTCANYQSVPDVDATGNPTGTTHQECTNWITPPPNPATPGSAIVVNSGRGASCYASTPPQPCPGNSWSADVILQTRCTLDIPEHVGVQ